MTWPVLILASFWLITIAVKKMENRWEKKE